MSSSANCTVYVGSIPFGVSDEQVVGILSEVGPVAEFKLIFDKHTGQHQGFGFATYKDADTAQSAIRNLDGREVQGRRLKVKMSAINPADKKRPSAAAGGGGGDAGRAPAKRYKNNVHSLLGLEKLKAPTSEGLQRTIEKVEGMTPAELYDVVMAMRNLAQQNPDMARHLLKNNPQFVFALLQAQLVIGMVQPQEVQAVFQRAVEGNRRAQLPPPPPAAAAGFGGAAPPPQFGYAQPPPSQQPPLPPPPPLPQGYAPQGALPNNMSPEHVRQVLALTPEQLGNLPPQQREQLVALRNNLVMMIQRGQIRI